MSVHVWSYYSRVAIIELQVWLVTRVAVFVWYIWYCIAGNFRGGNLLRILRIGAVAHMAGVWYVTHGRRMRTQGVISPSIDPPCSTLPRRKCGLETGRGVRCDSISSPLLLPIDRWRKVLCACLNHLGAPHLQTRSFSRLWWMMGVIIYINVHACACYVNGHTHADSVDCSTKVFFVKSSFISNSQKFTPSRVSRYMVCVKKHIHGNCAHLSPS